MTFAFTWGNGADLALAIFLIAVGLTLAYVFLRLAGTFGRVSAFVKHTEEELMPVIGKVGGTVDRVNGQLDKLDQMTDSAADAVAGVDSAVRSVSTAARKPVQKLAGVATGLSYGVSSLKTNRDWRGAFEAAKDAASRREHDLDQDLAAADGPGTPPAA